MRSPEPCLCGDPFCKRCFPCGPDGECPKCGGEVYHDEDGYECEYCGHSYVRIEDEGDSDDTEITPEDETGAERDYGYE